MNKFKELLEAKHKEGEVQTKDWDRMMDLELADKDGKSVANAIKDKNKAIARYIAGTRLAYGNDLPSYGMGEFSAFADKAIELGSSEEEIKTILNSTTIPPKVQDKYAMLKTKQLGNRFVGVISKAILKMGLDIDFLGKGGNAITNAGREAMDRNGRKWTIGYKAEIVVDGKKIPFVFDAITDEGDGPTSYVVDKLGTKSGSNDELGQRKFVAWLQKELTQYN